MLDLDLIKIRRHLHQIPEIGLEEHETQAYLLDIIHQLTDGKDFVQIKTWRTGILVHLQGSNPAKTIGWRTDIDGLPVTEETSLPYASQHAGKMHACGHDIHMTVALGLLSVLTEHQPVNNLLFLFQPAEENVGGGQLMYDEQAFGGPEADFNWLPDEFYGLHVRPDLPAGTIATNTHTLFAGTCEVRLTFHGVSGHAAFPHTANDALVAASYFVTQVQTVVSRNIDPVVGGVVTFGEMHAGTTNNVIAGEAELYGTIRSLTMAENRKMQERVKALAEGVASGFGMTVDIELIQGAWLPVENQPDLAKAMMDFFRQDPTVNLIDIAPTMTGEDFGYLLSKIPGVMLWLGVGSDAPLHSSKMTPDEAAIGFGVAAISKFLKMKSES